MSEYNAIDWYHNWDLRVGCLTRYVLHSSVTPRLVILELLVDFFRSG